MLHDAQWQVGNIQNVWSKIFKEGRKSPKRPTRGWSGDIRSDVGVIRCVQDRDRWCALVNAVMNLHIP